MHSLQIAPVSAPPAFEASLRVGARTISPRVGGCVSATTIIGRLSPAELAQFNATVDDIANEFDLKAAVRVYPTAFAVRFSH